MEKKQQRNARNTLRNSVCRVLNCEFYRGITSHTRGGALAALSSTPVVAKRARGKSYYVHVCLLYLRMLYSVPGDIRILTSYTASYKEQNNHKFGSLIVVVGSADSMNS